MSFLLFLLRTFCVTCRATFHKFLCKEFRSAWFSLDYRSPAWLFCYYKCFFVSLCIQLCTLRTLQGHNIVGPMIDWYWLKIPVGRLCTSVWAKKLSLQQISDLRPETKGSLYHTIKKTTYNYRNKKNGELGSLPDKSGSWSIVINVVVEF